ncbi:uncharacterized protein LOC132545940 isoform X2 [Ylistrum balloti]|uniref:uncharacterized protein LOC132545940 isoform X2 n=1 Tax=Ylistrum balloti TaxID=509963 RepID=UPI002905C061|nr:uncharacterized protein LOC132545940 isoform X2 [Ylistrum balloti]
MHRRSPMKEKYQIVETICGNLNPNKSSRSKGVFVNYEDIKEQKKVTLHVMRNVLLHALDACKAGSMSGNDSFLACTAIRSKNLLSCNKDDVESCAPTLDGKASYKERSRARDPEQLHMNCVWQTALKALMGTENFDKEKATSAMKASWNYCYNDLKPLGRRYIDWEEGE